MSRVFGVYRSLMAAASTKAAAAPSATAVSATDKAAKGILKPLPVSPAMRKFLGVGEISRPACVKKIWEHIKSHDLQNPQNKREIRCDDKLKSIFQNKDKVGMLEIAKLISVHFNKS